MDKPKKNKQVKAAQQSAEMSDQELDQVTGGTKWELSEYDASKNIKYEDIKTNLGAKTGGIKRNISG